MERNLHILSRFTDTASFVYIEHAVIERHDSSIEIRRATESVDVPAASISTVVLGPGTRISHAAMVALAECGAGVIWAGEEMQRFYASGHGKSRSASNLLRQASAWADPERRMEVVQQLYRLRFDEALPAELTLAQVRGREGVRVREAYAKASRDFGVPWAGRKYNRGDWDAADPVNRALSAGATVLYGICHSAIAAAGFSPGIGFIHTGKALAFVYDLADLYKVEVLVPSAFAAAADAAGRPETTVRGLLRQRCCEARIMDRIMRDLARLFDGPELAPGVDAESLDREDAPAQLWGPDQTVTGGVNYGGDDT